MCRSSSFRVARVLIHLLFLHYANIYVFTISFLVLYSRFYGKVNGHKFPLFFFALTHLYIRNIFSQQMHYKYLPFPLLPLLVSLTKDGAISWFHWRAVTDKTCAHTIYTRRNILDKSYHYISNNLVNKKPCIKIQISWYLNHFCFFSLFELNSFFLLSIFKLK